MRRIASSPPRWLPGTGSDVLGEGPWWSAASESLYRVDIQRRLVHRVRLDGTDSESWPTPQEVGFVIPRPDERSAVLGLRDGVYELDFASGVVDRLFALEADLPEQRFNDGKADRRGRVWFGSIHDAESSPVSSVYRWDGRGITKAFGAVITSNGIGWSPDDRTMYHTDSITRTITAYHYDLASGGVGYAEPFAIDPEGYVPDGLTVDSEGCVWSAKWDGGKVVKYAPDGRVIGELAIPARRPTSCMFVGPDLSTLAVTTARWGLSATDDTGALAGSVVLCDVDARGLPESFATV